MPAWWDRHGERGTRRLARGSALERGTRPSGRFSGSEEVTEPDLTLERGLRSGPPRKGWRRADRHAAACGTGTVMTRVCEGV